MSSLKKSHLALAKRLPSESRHPTESRPARIGTRIISFITRETGSRLETAPFGFDAEARESGGGRMLTGTS